ncbi:MAG: carbamoyltransferase [Acidobacteria bacterium]|nr:MAG: carbamoyltransferase [Acidobacteriota bacterium]REJ99073.1 MAG: carbamoyltransferase [Acidobacteriota bacterium]REK16207.1 MAG: carbamoyltransferase [Acidobacteriota bacterium]REK43888.1 MAG: carbamoyltransferase [Acidobacteriota bacterium]
MYILGLTTLGDSAASLIKDGVPIACAEEERFSRRKHHSGFPFKAIEYCLDHAGITLKDVEHVGHYWKPWILRHKAMQAVKAAFVSRDMFKARADRGVAQVSDSYLGMFKHAKRLREHFGPSDFKFHFLEHHQTHAASAFFVSPFESAAILTWDGTGEDTTTLFCRGEGNKIEVLKRIKLPHSLGQFYSAVTNYLGFDMFKGDEWKVMGLAAYGKPEYYDFFANKVLTRNGHGDFHFNIKVLDHHLAKHYQFPDEIVEEIGPARTKSEELTEHHWNIASSAQRVLEDTAIHLTKEIKRMTGEENLCMAGGVAFNSVMNGRIFHETPFKDFYVQPAAGDAGCSLGAALMVWHQKLGNPRGFVMDHAYYGPEFNGDECRAALDEARLKYETLDDKDLLPKLAKLISEGAIVGWFQGRMEWGPRALGSRSFLADPRRADMREILNHKVKLREWFRPLAPSMQEEHGNEVFGVEHHDPFMITVIEVAEEYKEKIPAVVHVDGTARPQMVSKKTNPRYWNLIEEFRKLTGIPMLLNTSFNCQEPIVCTPLDAVNTFNNARFDALVLEDNLVIRSENE